jgi:hypothetical protein
MQRQSIMLRRLLTKPRSKPLNERNGLLTAVIEGGVQKVSVIRLEAGDATAYFDCGTENGSILKSTIAHPLFSTLIAWLLLGYTEEAPTIETV